MKNVVKKIVSLVLESGIQNKLHTGGFRRLEGIDMSVEDGIYGRNVEIELSNDMACAVLKCLEDQIMAELEKNNVTDIDEIFVHFR